MNEHFDNKIQENKDTAKTPKQKYKRSKIIKNTMSANGFYETTLKIVERLLVDYVIFKRVANATLFLAENPVFFFPVCALCVSLGVPLLIFVIFACITTSIAFIGSMVFEGTVLAFGSVVLAFVLICVYYFYLIVLIVISVAYYVLSKLWS